MEYITLIMVSVTTMLSNVALVFMLYQMMRQQRNEPQEKPDEPQELSEEEKKRIEAQKFLDEGFANMMNYSGAPEGSDGQ